MYVCGEGVKEGLTNVEGQNCGRKVRGVGKGK